MSLASEVSDELKRLTGLLGHPIHTATFTAPDGVTLSVDFTAVDTMGCSFQEIRLNVPSLDGAGMTELKKWAEALSNRVTYLLENIGPVEFDDNGQQVLIRSKPPEQRPDGTQFYEVLLHAHDGGNFTLRRYHSVSGQPGRKPVEMQTTHEVLAKLAADLVDTVPDA